MKRFFCIFFVFFFIFACYTGASFASESFFDSITSDFDIDSAIQSLSSAENTPDQIETPFGRMQVLPSDSGTKNVSIVHFALQINIEQKGILSQIDLSFQNTQNVKKEHVYYPVTFPLVSNTELSYDKDVVIPFTAKIIDDGKEIMFDLIITAMWCDANSICQKQEYSIPIKVNGGKNYFSNYSSYILDSFRSVPLPATKEQIQIHPASNKTFWILINLSNDLQKKPKIVLFNAKNQIIPYAEKSFTSDKSAGIFVLQTDQLQQVSNVIIKTDYHIYSQHINQTQQAIPTIQSLHTTQNHIPVLVWLIFLLISPAFNLFLRLDIRNQIIAPTILNRHIIELFCGILCGCFIYFVCPFDYLNNSILWYVFCCLIFAYLLLCYTRVSIFAHGILTAILPYFVLMKLLRLTIPQNFTSLLLFFIILGIVDILPFLILRIKGSFAASISQKMQKTNAKVYRYPLIADLAIFILILLKTLYFIIGR